MQTNVEFVRQIAELDHLAVLSVARANGSVHSSLVSAGVFVDPVSARPGVGIVVRGGARKLVHLRAAGRASIVFRSRPRWVSVEGGVRLLGPDDQQDRLADRSLAQLLREIFLAAGGSHDNWDEYDRAMLEQRRCAVLVDAARMTTNG